MKNNLPHGGASNARLKGVSVSDPSCLNAFAYGTPRRRREIVIVCLSALVSFGLAGLLAVFNGSGTEESVVIAAMLSAYATPVLSAWPGAWFVARAAAARSTTFSTTQGAVEVGDKQLALDELIGRHVVKVAFSTLLLLTRAGDSESLMVELYGLADPALPSADPALSATESFGVIRFAVRIRRLYVLERVALGGCAALPVVVFGEWGLLILFFLGFAMIPTLWGLMILDLTGWRCLEVDGSTLRIGREVLRVSRDPSAARDPEAVVLIRERGAEQWGVDELRVCSYWGREGYNRVRIMKASIEAAEAAAGRRT